jgi:putative glutamine amidotransferase
MKKKLVVLVNDQAPYDTYVAFLKLKYDIELLKWSDFKKKDTDAQVELILFTGGEDVDPVFYNEKPGKHTSYNSERDSTESKMFRMFGSKIPKLGICRGSQFLTVMNGGRLIQHVENHGIGGTHSITFDYIHNHKMQMTSTHHQMMYPFSLPKKEYVLCAYSTNYLSPVYLNGNDRNIEITEDFLEPEIVLYPSTNSLAIQGHPESGVMKEDEKMFILDYINTILKL